ncbi:MAG: TIM barrel protein [Verrucomicrobia bacterium]|nr:TIM barrel protein [Verrucomicrobiota bacterium]
MRKATRIRIGNQTAFSATSAVAPFEYAAKHGFDAFEWFPDKKSGGAGWDENDLDAEGRSKIRGTAVACDIRLSVHARWQANPLQPEGTPILLKDVELAEDLGASLLNIHLYTEAGLDVYVDAVEPLVKVVVGAGLQLSIENTPLTSPEHFNELFARLRTRHSISMKHVGMCLDLGHANLCAHTRNDYLKYLAQLDRQVPIIHLHVHENWGDYDSHLPLFTGPAERNMVGVREFVAQMHARNFSGSIILEQWPHPPSLLNQARDGLKQLFAETMRRTPIRKRNNVV